MSEIKEIRNNIPAVEVLNFTGGELHIVKKLPEFVKKGDFLVYGTALFFVVSVEDGFIKADHLKRIEEGFELA